MASRISFHCPLCQKAISAPVSRSGKEAACPSCAGRIRVPEEQVLFVELPSTRATTTESSVRLPSRRSDVPVGRAGANDAGPVTLETSELVFEPVADTQQSSSDSYGVIGFVIGLLGLVLCGIPSPIALIFGLLGLKGRSRAYAVAGVVLGALGTLMMLAVAVLFVVSRNFGVLAGSPVRSVQTQLTAFEQQIDIYQLDVGVYPTTRQGLAALRVPPPDLADPSRWQGPYSKKDIPKDPWRQDYHYELLTPTQYKVYSSGPDGVPNTADDIINTSY